MQTRRSLIETHQQHKQSKREHVPSACEVKGHLQLLDGLIMLLVTSPFLRAPRYQIEKTKWVCDKGIR